MISIRKSYNISEDSGSRFRDVTIFFAIFSIIFGFLFPGCVPYSSPKVKIASTAYPIPKKLRIGVTPNYPPLIFKRYGWITGIEADLAMEIEKTLDRTVEYVELSPESLASALGKGIIDVAMSAMALSEEPSPNLRFLEPFMQTYLMALVREEDGMVLDSPSALNYPNLEIGYVGGHRSMDYVTQNLSAAETAFYYKPEEGVEALRNKKIDAFVFEAPVAWYFARNDPINRLVGIQLPFSIRNLSWAVSPKNETLYYRLNELIEKWKKSGLLFKIIDEWLHGSILVEPGGYYKSIDNDFYEYFE